MRSRAVAAVVWLHKAARRLVPGPKVLVLVVALLGLGVVGAVAVRDWVPDTLGAEAPAPQQQNSPRADGMAPQEQPSPSDTLWEDPPPCDPAELAKPYDDAPPPHPLEGGDPVCKAPPGKPIPFPAGMGTP
jgi:hypothetical protein